MIATARDVFPFVSFYFEGGQGILVGSNRAQETQPAFFERLERARTALDIADTSALATHLHGARLLGPREVDALLAATSPRRNTDANRFLEYATPTQLGLP